MQVVEAGGQNSRIHGTIGMGFSAVIARIRHSEAGVMLASIDNMELERDTGRLNSCTRSCGTEC